jgi:hypothetical protein
MATFSLPTPDRLPQVLRDLLEVKGESGECYSDLMERLTAFPSDAWTPQLLADTLVRWANDTLKGDHSIVRSTMRGDIEYIIQDLVPKELREAVRQAVGDKILKPQPA